MNSPPSGGLGSEHTKEAIARRLQAASRHSYLGDFILGAVDGAVMTYAIVAGAAGAGLSNGVVLVLGFANVLADGFSMAAGNYLAPARTSSIWSDFAGSRRRTSTGFPMGSTNSTA